MWFFSTVSLGEIFCKLFVNCHIRSKEFEPCLNKLIRVMLKWGEEVGFHLTGRELGKMKRRYVCLTTEQRGELLHVRDHDRLPYLRTKAAAIVKVADDWPIGRVAAIGLNKPYHEDTVRSWINRYEQEGLGGLRVKEGRGRKPAFSPCPSRYRNSRPRSARPALLLSASVWA